MEDTELLGGFVARGDRAALGTLLSRHADTAYRFALRLCDGPADAEDVLQSAYLAVFRNAASFRGDSSVKTWILGFVLNASRSKAREEARRRARQERAAAESFGSTSLDPELAHVVREAVKDLPERYRSPVWLHYGEGLSTAEVADVLRLPAETVRKQLSRGIDRLRAALLPYGAATGVLALLPALAVETAPTAAFVPAVQAGLASKLLAGAVAAVALASTASLLCWGEKSGENPPPDVADIERRVREWQPTPEERRFDEIGWAPDLGEALRLSRLSGRPVLLLTQSGRIHLGRSDGGSQFLRSRALSDPRIISVLNAGFVPVYLSNADFEEAGTGAPEERARRDRVWAEALDARRPMGMDCLYLLDPATGRVIDTLPLGEASSAAMLPWLEARKTAAGATLVRPSAQSTPPAAPPGTLILHLTARYLDAEGRVETKRPDFHEVPGEDWLWLSPEEWRTFLPPEGASWEVDPEIAARLLTRFHPSDMSVNGDPDGRNRIDEASLRVTRFSRTFVRVQGRLSMRRSFTQVERSPERTVSAEVKGFIEIEPDRSRVRSLRMMTESATYGPDNFGVAVRSAP
jgi:RNA polymerase sigma-70 factor, ECF subfamily